MKVLKKNGILPIFERNFSVNNRKIPLTDEFNAGEIVEIFRFAQFLEGADELVEKFDTLFAKMDQNQLSGSAIFIFDITKITNRGTTTSRIFGNLLKLATSQDRSQVLALIEKLIVKRMPLIVFF